MEALAAAGPKPRYLGRNLLPQSRSSSAKEGPWPGGAAVVGVAAAAAAGFETGSAGGIRYIEAGRPVVVEVGRPVVVEAAAVVAEVAVQESQ